MDLSPPPGFSLYPRSQVTIGEAALALARTADDERRLLVRGALDDIEGERQDDLLVGPLSASNAAALRSYLPWLVARPLGLQTSVGCGDRLGLATPGHLRAVRKVDGLVPILAQQSIRENARTGRTPQEVMDDALWGVLQEGWRAGYGADADHLKTFDDADSTAATGYTFFTIDPGEYVDDEAHTAPADVLDTKVRALPWDVLDGSPQKLRRLYLDQSFDLDDGRLTFSEESLLRAAAKYGRAVAHAVRMFRHLDAQLDRPWELEVSVDETATPTAHLEHLYLAADLKRLGVRWVSLAPRFVGEFEKGVDYIGDLDALRADFAGHAAIARAYGPYKLSLHSGSDKFSVYPIAVDTAGALVHLKTAGTSYLEALRAVARVRPSLFREIYALAFARYGVDRRTYHVSAEPERAPDPTSLTDDELPDVLDQFDAREMLHVTFGSALDRFGPTLKDVLDAHEEAHYDAIEQHFDRHLAPFA